MSSSHKVICERDVVDVFARDLLASRAIEHALQAAMGREFVRDLERQMARAAHKAPVFALFWTLKGSVSAAALMAGGAI